MDTTTPDTKPAAQETQVIPEGFMENAQHHLVPVEHVGDINIARNDLVIEMVDKAVELQKLLRDFKYQSFGDIQAFIELSAEKYGAQMGGSKGNVTLTSYDGRFKVQRSIADILSFDERAQVAKELIYSCAKKWGEESENSKKLKAIADAAFKVNSQGDLSTSALLSLRRLRFDDEEWIRAMDALSDALMVSGSRTYVRFFRRDQPNDKWQPISLDMANI